MDDSSKMSLKSENDESATNTNSTSSPAGEDAHNNEENENHDDKTPLKKGPWTASEDAILVEYIKKHGEGNWNAVQKNTELARCGKSCRLRWTNHLKPDLKKGAFSPEEEKLVVELHLQMGNKWARMASALPGRTDNEIKNFWNTRLKRRKRDGLEPYPSDLQVEPLNGDGPNDPMGPLGSIGGNNPCSATTKKMNEKDKFPPTEFKVFDLVEYLVTVPDFPSSTSAPQDLRSFYANKGYYCQFRPTPQENLLHGPGPVLVDSCVFSPQVLGIQNGGYTQIQENLICPPLLNDNVTMIDNVSNNGNRDSYLNRVITSPPELPSLQTQSGAWDSIFHPSSLPSLESYDSFVQSQTLPIEDQIVPTQNSGLLDAVIRGLSGQVLRGSPPQAMNTTTTNNNNKDDRPLHSSNIAVLTNDNSIRDLKEVEPKTHLPPPTSLSPPSIFSQGTTISPDSSLDALDLMCSNSGDELIFPEISIDGLELNYDDGDDIFSGLDLLPEPGHDDVPSQSTHQDFTIRGN